MNCPQCSEKAVTRGGGGHNAAGKARRYYHCRECGCDFEVIDGVARVQGDEPLPFRNRREALRSLYLMIAEDREWFGGVLPETEALAREVFATYLIGNRSKPAARREQQVRFRRGEGWAALRQVV